MHHQLCAQNVLLSDMDISFFLYETTPQAIRAVLPFPLEATLPPIVTINSWKIESNEGSAPITGSAVFIPCKYGHLSGGYCVSASLNADPKETFAHRIASIPLYNAETSHVRKDSRIEICVRGLEEEYISVSCNLDEPANIIEISKNLIYFFFYDSLDSHHSSIDNEPMLMSAYLDVRYNALEKSSGEIRFMASSHGIPERLEYIRSVAFLYGNIDINCQFRQMEEIQP